MAKIKHTHLKERFIEESNLN